jgi:phosphatidylethanolamine/phosphatidyl-N-methylethanolamine N-methyltransferase
MKAEVPQPLRSTARYDQFAPYYDRVMRPLERRLLARLREKTFAELPEDARLLEVGAGTGANFALYPRGTRCAANELSSAMIERARRKERANDVYLVQSCAERLPFANASFDAAVATLVFCSVTSPQKAFTELRRVVRKDGTIVLLEHVRPGGFLGYAFDALSIITVALFDDHCNRRTASEAQRAGLELLRVERKALGIINLIVLKNSLAA